MTASFSVVLSGVVVWQGEHEAACAQLRVMRSIVIPGSPHPKLRHSRLSDTVMREKEALVRDDYNTWAAFDDPKKYSALE